MATDNMSIDLTVDEDWRLQPVRSVNRDRQEATACDLKAKFAEALTKHGGVEQYLRLRFLETPGAACAFTDWLLQIFPLDANVLYDTSVRLETSDPQHLDMGRPLTLHPASLGWGPGWRALWPSSSVSTSWQTASTATTTGCWSRSPRTSWRSVRTFQTVSLLRAALLVQPAQEQKARRVLHSTSHHTGSLGYYKGKARASVLLALLDLAHQHGYANLQEATNRVAALLPHCVSSDLHPSVAGASLSVGLLHSHLGLQSALVEQEGGAHRKLPLGLCWEHSQTS